MKSRPEGTLTACDLQALGRWLWPLPEAVRRLGPLQGVLLKKLTLQAVGAAVAAFSLKVTCYLVVLSLSLDAAAAAAFSRKVTRCFLHFMHFCDNPGSGVAPGCGASNESSARHA